MMDARKAPRFEKVSRDLVPVTLWAILLLAGGVLAYRVISGDTLEQERENKRQDERRRQLASSTQISPAEIASRTESQAEAARRAQAEEAKAAEKNAEIKRRLTESGRTTADPTLRLPAGAPAGDGLAGSSGGAGGPSPEDQRRKTREQAMASAIVAWEDTAAQVPTGVAARPDPLRELLRDASANRPATPTTPSSPALGEYARLLGGEARSGGSGQTLVQHSESWLQKNGQQTTPSEPLKPTPRQGTHLLLEGTPIPLVLQGKVVSDLPGCFNAMVTRDIYDSIEASELLIPKGTRLRGCYNAEIVAGQERLLFAFNRMLFANGASVRLGAMPGTDVEGAAGTGAEVDNHFWKIFGSSLVVGMVSLAMPRQESNVSINLSGTTAIASGQALTEAVKSMLDRNKNIKPTLTLAPGERLTVVTTRDMTLPPAVTGGRKVY